MLEYYDHNCIAFKSHCNIWEMDRFNGAKIMQCFTPGGQFVPISASASNYCCTELWLLFLPEPADSERYNTMNKWNMHSSPVPFLIKIYCQGSFSSLFFEWSLFSLSETSIFSKQWQMMSEKQYVPCWKSICTLELIQLISAAMWHILMKI